MINIGVIPGRFNPATLAHASLFRQALKENKNGAYVVLIRGLKSGEDKIRNPLDADTQEALIKEMVPEIDIVKSDRGWLPQIIYEILAPPERIYLGDGNFKFKFYCGTDRFKGYKASAEDEKAINEVTLNLQNNKVKVNTILVEVVKVDRDSDIPFDGSKVDFTKPPTQAEISSYSATALRKAIVDGNEKLAQRMMGLEDNDLYEKIEQLVLKGQQAKNIEEKINSILGVL